MKVRALKPILGGTGFSSTIYSQGAEFDADVSFGGNTVTIFAPNDTAKKTPISLVIGKDVEVVTSPSGTGGTKDQPKTQQSSGDAAKTGTDYKKAVLWSLAALVALGIAWKIYSKKSK
jgi:hypothetical protein